MKCECCGKEFEPFDMAVALFDVINYIPRHDWWKNIPVKKGGHWIFDIWDKEKVDEDGFRETFKRIGDISRTITPLLYDGASVDLQIDINVNKTIHQEFHKMYVWSDDDIAKFCGKDFTIVGTKETKTWQKFYKLRRE